MSNERIFAEARELAQSRLQQYMADRHERLLPPPEMADRPEQSASDEVAKAAA